MSSMKYYCVLCEDIIPLLTSKLIRHLQYASHQLRESNELILNEGKTLNIIQIINLKSTPGVDQENTGSVPALTLQINDLTEELKKANERVEELVALVVKDRDVGKEMNEEFEESDPEESIQYLFMESTLPFDWSEFREETEDYMRSDSCEWDQQRRAITEALLSDPLLNH